MAGCNDVMLVMWRITDVNLWVQGQPTGWQVMCEASEDELLNNGPL